MWLSLPVPAIPEPGSLVAQALEDLCEEVADGIDHLVVVVGEGHLQVEADKLSQVTVSVAVLRAEHCNTVQTQ